MLVVDDVEVVYSNVIQVLRGVSLELRDGGVVVVLGANGAGKTTTLRAISGLLKTELGKITVGSIRFNGKRIDKFETEKIADMGIIQVREGRRIFPHLSVEANLMSGAHLRRDSKQVKADLEQTYTYFPQLKALRQRTSGYLSGGEQQMLVIGRAFMARPQAMLLDEPSLGLAPNLVKEIYRIIGMMNQEQGTSILLVEQNAKIGLSIAEHGYVMERGRIVLEGPAGELIENEDVKEFYFGLDEVGKRKSYRDVKHYKRRKRWL